METDFCKLAAIEMSKKQKKTSPYCDNARNGLVWFFNHSIELVEVN